MSTPPDIVRDVVALEERFWIEGGANPTFWAEHFADDGVVVLPVGIMDKTQILAAMAQAVPWDHADLADVRTVLITNEVVALAYRVSAQRAGTNTTYSATVSSVYVRRDDAWALAHHQQSPAT